MSGRFLKNIAVCVILAAFYGFIILYVVYKPEPSDNVDAYITLFGTLRQPPETVRPSKGPTTVYFKVREYPVPFSAEINESVDENVTYLKEGDRLELTMLKEEYR